MKDLKLDIVLGSNCNFKCKNCYISENFNNETFDDITLYNSTQFIIKLYKHCKQIANDDIILHLYVFGGEPLLYIDKLIYIVKILSSRLKDICLKIIVSITTNGSLIFEKIDEIYKLKQLCTLKMNVLYDYYFQNEARKSGTYISTRTNISRLNDINIPTRTITTFTTEKLKYFYDVVKDYYDFLEDDSSLDHQLLYNIDNSILLNPNLEFNEKEFTDSLQQANDYITENSLDRSKIVCNIHCEDLNISNGVYVTKIINNDTKMIKDIFTGNYFNGVLCAISYDGNIYTGMNVVFNESRNLFKFGTVTNAPKTIISKRNKLISTLFDTNIATDFAKCIDCNAKCKLYCWRTLKNNQLITNNCTLSDNWCRINQLLIDYNLC